MLYAYWRLVFLLSISFPYHGLFQPLASPVFVIRLIVLEFGVTWSGLHHCT